MGIDASIYGNVQPQQPVQAQNPIDTAMAGLKLSQMNLQNQQSIYQIQKQTAINQTLADNTDSTTGQVNQQGALSDLGKRSPQAAMELGSMFNAQNEQKAKAQASQAEAAQGALSFTIPAMHHLAGMSDDQRADAYPGMIKDLQSQGVDTTNFPADYDGGWFNSTYSKVNDIAANAKNLLANQAVQASTAKTNAETSAILPNMIGAAQKEMQADENYKTQNDIKTTGQSLRDLAKDALTNPVSASQLTMQVATLANNGKRVPIDEVEGVVKQLPGGDRILEALQKIKTGTATPDMVDMVDKFAATKMDSAAQAQADIADKYAKNLSVAHGINQDSARYMLTGAAPGTKDAVTPSTYAGKDPNAGMVASAKDFGSKLLGLGTKAGPASAQAAATPKPGAVVRGFVFNGGDPSNKANWKKAY